MAGSSGTPARGGASGAGGTGMGSGGTGSGGTGSGGTGSGGTGRGGTGSGGTGSGGTGSGGTGSGGTGSGGTGSGGTGSGGTGSGGTGTGGSTILTCNPACSVDRTCCDGSTVGCDGTTLPSGDGPNSNEFVISADLQTVTDTITGLVWERGEDWQVGAWGDALNYCAGLTLGGVWRLPTRKEFLTILDYTQISPKVDPVAFPVTEGGYYWTSSVDADLPSNAWAVNLGGGDVDTWGKADWNLGVRCVR
jgi:hypothetical protein